MCCTYGSLGVNGPELEDARVCRDLAQESPQDAERRVELQNKLERLESASEELLSIGI